MLSALVFRFLKDLSKNNDKQWFDKHRKHYELVKTEFALVVDLLIKNIATFDPAIGSLQAKDCMFRINRDIRFSKDKSPYKTNMGAFFSKGGKKHSVGYYFHCEPGKSFIAGGCYSPMPPELASIRQEIDY